MRLCDLLKKIGLLCGLFGDVMIAPPGYGKADGGYTGRVRTFGNWSVVGDANWTEVDGIIQANAGSGFLVSKESFSDVHLKLEFWPDKDTNSGVFVRCSDIALVSDATCYEVNIFDSRPDPSGRTGAIVGVAAPRVSIDTEGRWNTYEIKAEKTRLVVKLNGVVTVDMHHDAFRAGPVALQLAKGGIRFRNIEFR